MCVKEHLLGASICISLTFLSGHLQGFFGEMATLLSPVAAGPLLFTATEAVRLWVFKAVTELGRGREDGGKLQLHKVCCSLRVRHFS